MTAAVETVGTLQVPVEEYGLTYRGLVFGEGSDYELVSLEGLDLPDMRTGDSSKPLDHGEIAGSDFLQARVLTLTLEILSPNQDTLYQLMDAIERVTQPSSQEYPLVIRLPGRGAWVTNVRLRKRNWPVNQALLQGAAVITLQFKAPDPRLYSIYETTASTALASSGSGFTFPMTFPLRFDAENGGAVAQDGVLYTEQTGTHQVSPLLRITGPITRPVITHLETGETLTLNVSLGSYDEVVVDTQKRTVQVNGTSTYQAFSRGSTWFRFAPGTNRLRFQGDGDSQRASRLYVSFRAARA